MAADEGRNSKVLEGVFVTPPSKLFSENRSALLDLGVSSKAVDEFLGNTHYNPANQAIIVRSLSTKKGVVNAEAYIRLINVADSVLDTVYFQRVTEMLAWYHKEKCEITKLGTTSLMLPTGFNKNGGLIVPLYFDYASWSREAADFARAIRLAGNKSGASSITLLTNAPYRSKLPVKSVRLVLSWLCR